MCVCVCVCVCASVSEEGGGEEAYTDRVVYTATLSETACDAEGGRYGVRHKTDHREQCFE